MYKKFKLKIFAFFAALLLLVFNSCETTELELLNSPNALSPSSANIDFFLTSIQTDLAYFFENVTEEGMETTRILHMYGPVYENAYAASQFNNAWSRAYASTIADVRTYTPVALEQELYTHVAIGQIIEAYMMTTLVDYFGDVPYSESNDGVSLNPNVDTGASIYSSLLTLLDDAIANLNKDEAKPLATDLFYDGDESKWIKFANTLKLKLYLQSRLVNESESKSGINAILTSGNYISSSADDFQFNWSSTDENPDSRHPIFGRNFVEGSGVTDYMSNHFMNELAYSKSMPDPRLRYYFYRQSDRSAESTVEQACYGTLPPAHYGFSIPYCSLDNGFWGRDHGDDGGIPPDTSLRITWGVYPVGGNYDNDSFVAIPDRNIGLVGKGISPIMLSSYVEFMLAEANLTMGTTGDARTYLTNGMSKSIEKVMAFGSSIADENFTPTSSDVSDYMDEVLGLYDNADNDEKLNIIVKEYFISLFGNGVEAYNTYRRTGKPDALQPLRKDDTDKFIRSFYYPTDYVNQNSNATQKPDVFQKVFWDTNADSGFIN
jgi:SusD/RagB-like outer membrane lipoprotein